VRGREGGCKSGRERGCWSKIGKMFGVSCKVLMLVLYIDHLKHNSKLSMRWQNVGPMASQKQDDFLNKVIILCVE